MELKISSTWNKILRWLQKSTSEDKEVLSVVHVEDDWTGTSDGFRLHAVEGRPGWPEIGSVLDAGNWDFAPFKAADTDIEPLGVGVNYPDVLPVLPEREPIAEIVVDGDFLLDALGPMRDSLVRLRIYHTRLEIFGGIGEIDGYALIAHNSGQAPTWKPERKEQE